MEIAVKCDGRWSVEWIVKWEKERKRLKSIEFSNSLFMRIELEFPFRKSTLLFAFLWIEIKSDLKNGIWMMKNLNMSLSFEEKNDLRTLKSQVRTKISVFCFKCRETKHFLVIKCFRNKTNVQKFKGINL